MTQLTQNPSAVPGSGLFTYSGWFRSASFTPPVGSLQGQSFGYLDLFATGNLNTGPFAPDAYYTSISVSPNGLLICLCGPQGGYVGTAAPFGRFSLTGAYNTLTDKLFAQGVGITGFADSFQVILTITFGANFPRTVPLELNTWHHLFVSADTTGGASFIIDVPPPASWTTFDNKFNIFLDRVDVLGNTLGAPTVQQNGISIGYDDPGNPSPETITIAPFSIKTSEEMSIPSLTALINDSPQMERANTQVWFGQYIAPTSANLDKFVVLDGNGNPIMPPDVRAAQDAFGPSDIWFVRDNVSDIKFEDNQGAGGAFTVVGTPPIDFQPGPEDV